MLFEAADEIGGQLNVAKQIPGKQEFNETIRYFGNRLAETGVTVRLGTHAGVDDLKDYDEIVLATGVTPRMPDLPGQDHPKVVGYLDVLRNKVEVGKRVAILGAGGIGFDVAEFLTSPSCDPSQDIASFLAAWGVDPEQAAPGGLTTPVRPTPPRQVTLMQRKASKLGAGLGKTTGWIHRLELKHRGVDMVAGASYDRIDDDGLHFLVDDEKHVLAVDNVVLCTGQESNRRLSDELKAHGIAAHLIGGADIAAELDAKRAIDQGTRLAAAL